MSDLTPIQRLTRDHLGYNTSRATDGVSTLTSVVEYLRMICPNEDDLLLYSDKDVPATNTGRLFAVTRSKAAFLRFGRGEHGEFTIGGEIYPLSAVTVVRIDRGSTVWPDGVGGGAIGPDVTVEFADGTTASFGRRGKYGWAARYAQADGAEDDGRIALMGRLMA